MIVVILAAGASYRMRPLTDHMPKCMLKIGDKTILGQIMDNISLFDFKDVLVITGYKEEIVKDFLQSHYPQFNIRYATNEVYSTTSDSVSVFQTQPHVKGQDILLIDSDQWFYPGVITKLLQKKEADVVAIYTKEKVDEEAVKVVLGENSRIVEMGKPVDIRKAVGEAVGVRKFSAAYMEKLYTVLERRIVQEGIVDQVFEYSVQELLEKGVPLFAADTSEWPSIEMDTPQDYERAKQMVAEFNAR